MISDDELKYQLAEDVKLKVKAVCYYKDGTKIEGELGEDGGETQLQYALVTALSAEADTVSILRPAAVKRPARSRNSRRHAL